MSNHCEGTQYEILGDTCAIEFAPGIAGAVKQAAETTTSFKDAENRKAVPLDTPRPSVPFSALLPPGANKNFNFQGRDSGMTRKSKDKMEVPICGRLSADRFRVLETWCDFSFRKRSEVVGMVLERVLEILEQQSTTEMPVEQFVRRLRVDPP